MDYYVRYEENGTVCSFSEEIHNLEQEIIKLEQKLAKQSELLAKAVEGLKFYADKNKWYGCYNDNIGEGSMLDVRDCDFNKDEHGYGEYLGGKLAREILKELGE